MNILLGEPISLSELSLSLINETVSFLQNTKDEHFLDFIEYIFQYKTRKPFEFEILIDPINYFLQEDSLPYYVTGSSHDEIKDERVFPRVISRDDETSHSMAIKPALDLLSGPGLSAANVEFRKALEHYRKLEYGLCLTMCCTALESLMKIICSRNRWIYQQNDTASRLLKTIIDSSDLEPFFEQPIIIIATLRNRLSPAHGAGTQKKDVSRHKAKYAVTVTASAMLLLAEECL